MDEFLAGEQKADGEWSFDIGSELHGAFGGAFGGVIAACCVRVARGASPGRVPTGVDCRFVRALAAGRSRIVATKLHEGRSLSTLNVDVFDDRDRLCTRALVSLVAPDALKPADLIRAAPHETLVHYEDAESWPVVAPIVGALDARALGRAGAAFATGIRVPWDVEGSSAESACLAADLSVGMPIGAAVTEAGESLPRAPNPDLAVRFCGEVTTPVLAGVTATRRLDGGLMALSIDVWSGDRIVAAGVSSALVLSG
jgi:acyl-coenzyme A thioesterase PaaI-like protein